jgi:hypothetical protein
VLRSPLVPVILWLAAAVLAVAAPEEYEGHGLRAAFYPNTSLRGPPALQTVVRSWDVTADGNLASSNQANYSVRWEGFLEVEEAGRYAFLLDSDDGSGLWIDDRPVVQNPGTHMRRHREGTTHLAPGEHRLKLEFFQGVGDSFFRLRWKPPGETSWQALPLKLVRPAPRDRFDQEAADRSGRNRMLVSMLALVLLLGAVAHIAGTRWKKWTQTLHDGARRRDLFKRLAGSALTHDILCVLVCLGFYLQTIAVRLPHEPFLQGDAPYYANTVISILYDLDLDQRNQSDASIFEQPKHWTNVTIYTSNISRGTRGEWYPKHTLVFPFLSVPFYAAFGGMGLLLFNLVTLLLLVLVVRRVARMFASAGAACVATVLVGITPLFHHYAYSYSADILAALLVVGGAGAALGRRGILAGVLLGLATWVKVPNGIAVVLAGGLLLVLRDWRTLWRYCLGSALSLGTFAGFNWYQFGAPWITSYQRVWTIERGASRVGDHVNSFGFPFWEGMRLQLVDSIHGLIPTAGVSLLAALGYGRLFKSSRPAFALILLFSVVTFLMYCKYDYITGSTFSNRFLMPVVALSAVPLACLVDTLVGKARAQDPESPSH